jgi:hypothetical protein
MLGFKNKRKQKETNAGKVRLGRKILGKDSGRRIFGFACSPKIQAQLKMLADKYQVPLFALVEHGLQISSELFSRVADEPEEYELLRRHIIDDHVGKRTIEKVSHYDEETGDLLYKEKSGAFQIEKVVHQIVRDFVKRGMPLSAIAWYLDYGYRCFIAVMSGLPVPKPQEEKLQFYRKYQRSNNQPAEEKESNSNDDSPNDPPSDLSS